MHHMYEKIDNKIVDLHAKLPHLPTNGRQWLANNIWWIVLIAAVVGAFGVFVLMVFTLIGGIFWIGAAFLFAAKFGGLALLAAMLVLFLTLANVVLAIMAISPLKTKRRNGWLLLLASLFAGFIAALLTDFISVNEWAAVKEVVFFAIGLYVMYEVREYFTQTPPDRVVTDSKSVSK